ncbi:MAG: hypothetical protein JXA67_22420, partial [Micromonosporaceae bacterium]|nr:hypothetical protein [Micromonosporaceae bacterium]
MVRRLSAVSCGLVSCQPDAWTVYCGGRLAVVATDGDQLLLDLEIDDTAAGYDRLIGQLVRLVTRPEGVTVVTTVSCSIVAELLNAAGVTLVAVDEKEAWRLAELSGLAGYAAEPVGHAGRPGRRPAGSAGQVARPDRYAARPGSPGQRAAGLAGA